MNGFERFVVGLLLAVAFMLTWYESYEAGYDAGAEDTTRFYEEETIST